MKSPSLMPLALVAAVLLSCSGKDAGPQQTVFGGRKALDRETAKRILESQGYRQVAIGAIVQGATRFGEINAGDSGALVFAAGLQQGVQRNLATSFFFDEELGWFTFEKKDDESVLRLWSAGGYQEINPAPASPSPSPSP